jgi:hypothetical protein
MALSSVGMTTTAVARSAYTTYNVSCTRNIPRPGNPCPGDASWVHRGEQARERTLPCAANRCERIAFALIATSKTEAATTGDL